MDKIEKPDGMPAEHWEMIENASSLALKKQFISLWENMRACEGAQIEEGNAEVIQFPLWPEPKRASPNTFLRSAIFAAIQGKYREYIKNSLLISQNGYQVRFTGQRLDQSDFDVWLQAAHEARRSPVGDECVFKAYGFLKSLGRHHGKTDYEWLRGVLTRLQTSMVEVRLEGKWFRLNLIEKCAGDDVTTLIKVKFSKEILRLFASDDWTALQWEERKQLKGKPLALWLHGYYSSHASPYPVNVVTLRDMSGSTTKELKHFKAALKRAFVQLGAVAGFKAHIEGDLVFVETVPSPTQRRHIQRSAQARRLPRGKK